MEEEKRSAKGGFGVRRKDPLTIWVIRHGEREDNVSHQWRSRARKLGTVSWDDSPLSSRGRLQADECSYRFSSVNFDFVFSSPFIRCVETSAAILCGRWTKIKVEPGLCELLSLCAKPAGFMSTIELRSRYPHIDTDYYPVVSSKDLCYDYERHRIDQACVPRVAKVMNSIIDHCYGNVLIVTHGAVVGAIHDLLVGGWMGVGQATLTKFAEIAPAVFTCEFSDDASHLSDRTKLRRS